MEDILHLSCLRSQKLEKAQCFYANEEQLERVSLDTAHCQP